MLFKHPTSAIFYAASAGGKSSLVLRILKERDKLFDKKITEVLYYYSCWNEAFNELKDDVTFIEGPVQDVALDGVDKIIVADDQLDNASSLSKLISLHIRQSHHLGITVFLLTQSLFFSKSFRTISLNTKMFFLFNSLRDKNSVSLFIKQLQIDKEFLKEAYKDATKKRYGYLCINLTQNIADELRISTDIFETHPTYYLKRGTYKGSPLPVSIDG